MNIYVPDYYNEFKCIADKCRHNCCIGWEIDIDIDAMSYYKSIKGEFGQRLKDGICDCDTPHFILRDNERCPFLNDNNLCDIITTLGEDKLCRICTDHPRFRSFLSSRTELGLGLCCEEACRLILSSQRKMSLVPYGKHERVNIPEEETIFLNMRQSLFDIVQDRDFSVSERIENLVLYCGSQLKCDSLGDYIKIYQKLERLDPDWSDIISRLGQKSDIEIDCDIALEQLLCYFLLRHLSDGLYDGMLSERIDFCILSVLIIQHLCGTYENADFNLLCEIARMYSSEIEYSETNISDILECLSASYM